MAIRVRTVFAAGVLLALVGCSGSSELSVKPDSTLTYDVVARDVEKYRGKRVRWLGQFANGSAKDKAFGNGSSLDAVFVDTRTDLRVDLRAFAVQGQSDKGNIDFMFEVQGKPVWVIGTVAGVQHTKMTVGPPPEERELEVPLLRNAVFEAVDEKSEAGVTDSKNAPAPVAVTAGSAVPVKTEQIEDKVSGDWHLFMRTKEWDVRLRPRPGLPGEFLGTARRGDKDEKGEVVTMELGASLTAGKFKAWLGPGFVVCEAAFSAAKPMEGDCKAMNGDTGPFRAQRRE